MKKTIKTDVYVYDYPYHKNIYDEVLSFLDQNADFSGRSTNVKANITRPDITSPEIERLKKYVLEKIVYDIDPIFRGAFFENFWANIYHKGDYAVPHKHIPSFYSIVYFLKSNKNFSPLVFSEYKDKIVPKEGRLVIFNSGLIHEVPKHKFLQTRITLSANISTTLKR